MKPQPLRTASSRNNNMQNKMMIANLHCVHAAAESLVQSGYTVLAIDLSGTPKITIQWQGKCAQLKPTRLGRVNNEAGDGFIMRALIKKCLVTWIEPAYVKELQDRHRTRPVTIKPKSVTRIQHWGIKE
ncbi:MAG: hypothetical protein JKY50_20620 [Oleispira sp.]|nr:hypothetical protein [Oleispira sp.]